MKQKGFSITEILLVVSMFSILVWIIIGVWMSVEQAKKRAEQAKVEISKQANLFTRSQYKVLSKIPADSGNEIMVLKDQSTGDRVLFKTCHVSQRTMVVGDLVQFEYEENRLENLNIACHVIFYFVE